MFTLSIVVSLSLSLSLALSLSLSLSPITELIVLLIVSQWLAKEGWTAYVCVRGTRLVFLCREQVIKGNYHVKARCVLAGVWLWCNAALKTRAPRTPLCCRVNLCMHIIRNLLTHFIYSLSLSLTHTRTHTVHGTDHINGRSSGVTAVGIAGSSVSL